MKYTNTSFKKSVRGMTLSLAVLLMLSGAPATVSAASATDNAVLLMASMGVITPDSSGSYNLGSTLTRAEFATMLVKASPYDNMVAAASNSSPFTDVKSTHWASAYVKVAASNGLLSGYSDGTFRPEDPVTLEQAVNSVLILMGYTAADFSGAYPHAQMNVFNSTKLSNNINGTVGSHITKETAVKLLYNAMAENVKDSSSTYAETLGYSLNSSGEVDYAEVISSNMNGPYTVTGDWVTDLGIAAGAVIYKNGVAISQSDVKSYDIVYYSTDKGTVYVYSDKVTGIYEKASPNQSTVTSVTVSGKEYQLESTTAFTAFSTSGNLKVGSTVTLLLGKDGKVADAVSSLAETQELYLYVMESGTKTFTDSEDKSYTAQYIKGVTPEGREVEYSVSSYESWASAGNMLKLTFNGDSIKVSSGGKSLEGKIQAELMTIGNSSVSSDATIIDTYEGSYKYTSMERLDGITLEHEDVLYYRAVNGQITELVLNDVTGDVKSYGIVTSVSSGENSGSYEYILNGEVSTLRTTDRALGVKKGPATLLTKSGQLDNLKNLNQAGGVTEVTSQYVVADGVTHYFAPEVSVYVKSASDDYRLTDIDAAVSAGKKAAYYYDEKPADGGRIRIVVISE